VTWGLNSGGAPIRRLAIVRHAVVRLGGRLEISEPPGATFTVTLPVIPAPAQRVSLTPTGASGRSGSSGTPGAVVVPVAGPGS